jgi:hypothetical protein
MGAGDPENPASTPARIGVWTQCVGFFGLVCLVGGLLFLRPALVPGTYGYVLGTPTTATVDHCASRGGTCDGRWSVGGASPQAGPILGVYDGHQRAAGSQVDVHVRGATAYTPGYARLIYPAMAAGFFAFATGGVLLWSARRKYRTGSWPWHRSGPPPS